MKGQCHYYSSTRLCQCRSPLSVAQFSIANTSFCPLFCSNKSNSTFDASLKHDLMSLPDKGKREGGGGGFLPKLSLCFRVCRIMLDNRVLCFRASPVKLGYYAQNYAQLEVLCSNYAGLKWHFQPPPPSRPIGLYLLINIPSLSFLKEWMIFQ